MTPAKEEAMEAPERDNSPRCPTNITDIICITFCNKFPAIIGPASHSCFLTSVVTSSLLSLLQASVIRGVSSWVCSSILFVSSSSLSLSPLDLFLSLQWRSDCVNWEEGMMEEWRVKFDLISAFRFFIRIGLLVAGLYIGVVSMRIEIID